MPKIIENLRVRLMEEAKKQIVELGYASMTMRSIAKGCGVGIGTVYNYFPSKDALLAAYLLEDWNGCIAAIRKAAAAEASVDPVLQCIHTQLLGFIRRHYRIIQDARGATAASASSVQFHKLLRSQLAESLRKYCSDDFLAEFLAEAMLIWSVEGKEFEEIYGILRKLL